MPKPDSPPGPLDARESQLDLADAPATARSDPPPPPPGRGEIAEAEALRSEVAGLRKKVVTLSNQMDTLETLRNEMAQMRGEVDDLAKQACRWQLQQGAMVNGAIRPGGLEAPPPGIE